MPDSSLHTCVHVAGTLHGTRRTALGDPFYMASRPRSSRTVPPPHGSTAAVATLSHTLGKVFTTNSSLSGRYMAESVIL